MTTQITVEGAETIPSVVADRQLLRHGVLNLGSNAIKYNRPGGRVTILMERVAEGVASPKKDKEQHSRSRRLCEVERSGV